MAHDGSFIREDTSTESKSISGTDPDPKLARRHYLALVGSAMSWTGAAGSASAVTASSTTTPCRGNADERVDEMRDRLADRQDELETVREETAAIRDETEAARKAMLADRTSASEDLRVRARSVGQRVRKQVVLLMDHSGYERIGKAGWFVDETRVISSGFGTKDVVEGWLPNGDSFECEQIASSEWGQVGASIYETEYEGHPLQTGDPASVSTGDPLLKIGHTQTHRHWLIMLGEAMEPAADDGDARSMRSRHSFVTFGSPLVTLAGDVVGMANGYGPLQEQPEYLQRPVIPETLPVLASTRSVPVDRIEETVEASV